MPDLTNSLLLTAIPFFLSGFGWIVVKVVQHDAWLVAIRLSLERVEVKLDKALMEKVLNNKTLVEKVLIDKVLRNEP